MAVYSKPFPSLTATLAVARVFVSQFVVIAEAQARSPKCVAGQCRVSRELRLLRVRPASHKLRFFGGEHYSPPESFPALTNIFKRRKRIRSRLGRICHLHRTCNIADAGFSFVNWTGAYSSAAPTCSMTVSISAMAQANFAG
jgi:hypothetical protein